MAKIKFVTSYYMDITEFTNDRWIGSYPSRKQRYLASIIYHCKNFPNYEVVCYTHQISFPEIEKIKIDYDISNLTIKIKELNDIKYTNQVDSIIDSLPDYMERFGLSGRPPQVMWGKFDLMREESTNTVDYLYWVDAGLQSVVLFPIRYNPNMNDEDFLTSFDKLSNFGLLFNETLINKLTNNSNDKFVTLLTNYAQDTYYSLEGNNTKYGNYPIAGFFGGEKKAVLEYCDYFDNAVDVFIRNNILCFEQTIMKYVTDLIPLEKLHVLYFDTHAIGLTEQEFHYDKWDSNKNLPKPIWRIWEEIRDNN